MGLILSNNDNFVDRQQLMLVPTPQPTTTWRPIPHIDVVEAVSRFISSKGWSITDERYGLARDQQKMFGIMTLSSSLNPEWTRCIGIRNSHDKSLCLGITVGVSVLVCSNLAFGGTRTIHRRHTKNINIAELINDATVDIENDFVEFESRLDRLKDQRITEDMARNFIVRAAEADAIPSCDILAVLREFLEPSHEAFIERTQWSLLNAFTEIAHKYSPARADKCHRQLTQLFQLAQSQGATLP